MIVPMTLVYVVGEDQVLLGHKKRGFGAGRWNGFGGKTLEREPLELAAKRELLEESGLVWQRGVAAGFLRFTHDNTEDEHHVHLFRATAVSGEPVETEEMKPQWFSFKDIPLDHMWPDDRYWLAEFLSGKSVEGHFHFADADTILRHQVAFR